LGILAEKQFFAEKYDWLHGCVSSSAAVAELSQSRRADSLQEDCVTHTATATVMGQMKTRQIGRERDTMGMTRQECVSWPAHTRLQYDQPACMPVGIREVATESW